EGIGPGDYFAKTLIEALPAGDTIGLVPCAIPGVDIDFFVKGVVSARRGEFTIPPDNHWDSAYDWVIERAQLAQAAGGVIDGIIFHQGESDSGEPNRSLWSDKVKGIVEDLRTDLGGEEFPFVAGELLYSGCCGSMNMLVNQLPNEISNTYTASAEGLNGVDQYHFDAPGVRSLGQRYGEAMIEALGLGE
ncbi:MAG TPA: sialate O-acetylesterase, partial [Polyangiaceae bacterium]|nr:sialate O-acetylesterase [Polyangiaceae bacterium]